MHRHCWAAIAAAAVISVPAPAAPVPGTVNREAIARVASGRTQVAHASWWGFDPDDATRALQAAIDSGARKVIVENVGRPWIVVPIRLAGNQEVVFEKGVEVLAKQGAFHGTNDALFHADGNENVTLRGYGATLRMRRADYAGPDYEKAEWRHVLDFRSCANVRVEGLTLAESGGDGIYLGTGRGGLPNRNVRIKEVICDRNYRQGISVITAENLLIEDCLLRDTTGTAPAAGIDFEPNVANERLVNCVMRRCVSRNNRGGGYLIALRPMTMPVSLRFEDCQSIGDGGAGASVNGPNAPRDALRGSITFEGCSFQENGGPGIVVANKPTGGCSLRFAACAIVRASAKPSAQAPIVFLAGREAAAPVGGVTFGDVRVRDPGSDPPMKLVDMAGVGLQGVAGRLILETGNEHRSVELTGTVLAGWMPHTSLKPIPRLKTTGVTFRPVTGGGKAAPDTLAFARLRTLGRLLLSAARGDDVRLRLRYLPVASYNGRPLPAVVVAPSGTEVARVDLAFRGETEVRFTAPETGVYRLTADPGANALQIATSSHPLTLDGGPEPVHLFGTTGTFYFWVPAGTTTFGVRVSGDGPAEAVRAALVDPTGRVVAEVDNVTGTHQFEVTLPRPSDGAAWRLRIARPSKLGMEDEYVDLRGIPPLLAAAPEGLLMP